MKLPRQKVYDKYNGHCAYCGVKMEMKDMQVDHIQPKFHYQHYRHEIDTDIPVDSFENLNPSCRRCNNWKRTFTVEKFRHEIQSQQQRLRDRVAGYRLALDYGLVKESKEPVKFYFETR